MISETKTRCPRCAAQGKDRHGDNLSVYSDGHSHCYSCGYHTASPMAERVAALANAHKEVIKDTSNLNFPKDYTKELPKLAIDWLKTFGIRDEEIEKHRFGWSPGMNFLIFPIFDKDGNLLMWQGRNLNTYPNDKPKYLTGGPKSDIIYKVGDDDKTDKTIVLCEDLLSAIKIGRMYKAVPIWGSTIALGMIRTLARDYDMVGIWLDPDKKVEAVKQALRASQYVSVFVVESALDPKQYETVVIHDFIEQAAKEAIYQEEKNLTKKVIMMPKVNECYIDFYNRSLSSLPPGSGGVSYEEYSALKSGVLGQSLLDLPAVAIGESRENYLRRIGKAFRDIGGHIGWMNLNARK